MARMRNLKPGFFTNEDLAECTPWARLCFAGLWTIADRDGRLEDRPRRIKGQLFSMDNVDVDPLLAELQAHGFILRYRHEAQDFIQILKFHEHQNPHFREPDSVIPPPQSLGLDADANDQRPGADDGLKLGDALGRPGALVDKVDFESRGSPPVESPLSRAEPGTQNPEPKPLAQRAERSAGPPATFGQFWSAYPRHVGKRAAEKVFAKLRPDEVLLGVMLAALARQRQSDQWRRDGGQFIPHAATWLNGRRWEDEAEPARGDGANDAPSGDDGWLRRAL